MLLTADTVITARQNAAARDAVAQLLEANRAAESRRWRPSGLTRYLAQVLSYWDDDNDGRAALRVWQEAEATAQGIDHSVPGQMDLALFHRDIARAVEKALEQTRS